MPADLQNNALLRTFLLELARECDSRPTEKLDEIAATVRTRFASLGVPGQLIRGLEDVKALESMFEPRLVPNPGYWQDKLNRRFAFLSVQAPAKRYNQLIDMLRDISDISHYVCYGELDVLIRLLATREDVDQIEEFLVKHGFKVRVYPVDLTVVFAGFRIPERQRYMPAPLQPHEVDEFLSARADRLDPALVERLRLAGLVLGTVYYEDHRATGRIRAFMGVGLRDDLELPEKQRFEQALAEINETETRLTGSEPIVSVFRCKSQKYPYLIQMVCDDQDQLDRLTDYIQTLHATVYDTVTYVVAKHEEQPIQFSDRRRAATDNFEIATGVMSVTVTPLTESLRELLPEELNVAFRRADANRQFQVLKLYDELLVRNPYATTEARAAVITHFLEFIRSVLTDNPSAVKSVGLALMRDLLEPEHKAFAATLVDTFFEGESSKFQSELSQANADWRRWGLTTWADHVYPAWNRHPLLSAALSVDAEVIESLRFLGVSRNSWAHDRAPVPFEELVHRVREAFHNTYRVLKWLVEARNSLTSPQIPVAAIWRVLAEDRKGKIFDALRELRGLQIDVADAMRSAQERDSGRWEELLQRVRSLQEGRSVLDEAILQRFEEMVLPTLQESDLGTAQKILAYLRSASGAIPAGTAGSLLATLIAKAMGM